MIEAWHLPGLREPGPEWRTGRTPSGSEFRAPVLTADQAERVAISVRSATLECRAERSAADVIAAVAAAARRLTAPGPEGAAARKLLCVELGWDAAIADETLTEMSRGWTQDALASLVEAELGTGAVLDGFARDPAWKGPGRRRRHAAGPPVLLHVLAGNVPGVAITAAIRALVVRSGVLCKLPASEPGLLPAFARILANQDALLGRCIGATWWPGAEFPVEWRAWTRLSGKAVVYGGNETVRSVRAAMPAHTEIVEYGPKTGVAVILPGERAAAAHGLAVDICAYDQHGCVSPRLVYVIGDAARPFVEELAAALDARTRETPPPRPTDDEAVAIRSARASREFVGFARGATAVVAPGDSLEWTILWSDEPGAAAEALPRVAWVYRVPDLEVLESILGPLEGRIQAIGYAGTQGRDRVAELATRLGVSRVAPIGAMAWPPPDWRHDGRHQLLPLVNWTDFEEGA